MRTYLLKRKANRFADSSFSLQLKYLQLVLFENIQRGNVSIGIISIPIQLQGIFISSESRGRQSVDGQFIFGRTERPDRRKTYETMKSTSTLHRTVSKFQLFRPSRCGPWRAYAKNGFECVTTAKTEIITRLRVIIDGVINHSSSRRPPRYSTPARLYV